MTSATYTALVQAETARRRLIGEMRHHLTVGHVNCEQCEVFVRVLLEPIIEKEDA